MGLPGPPKPHQTKYRMRAKNKAQKSCVFIKSAGSQNPGTGSTETTCDHHTNEHTARFISKSSDIIVLVYVDDCIILSRDKISIELFIASLKHGLEGFDFTNEGTMDKYLGVNIERLKDNNGFTMSQPYLIERIMQAAHSSCRSTFVSRQRWL